jgi:hypothetical protein
MASTTVRKKSLLCTAKGRGGPQMKNDTQGRAEGEREKNVTHGLDPRKKGCKNKHRHLHSLSASLSSQLFPSHKVFLAKIKMESNNVEGPLNYPARNAHSHTQPGPLSYILSSTLPDALTLGKQTRQNKGGTRVLVTRPKGPHRPDYCQH